MRRIGLVAAVFFVLACSSTVGGPGVIGDVPPPDDALGDAAAQAESSADVTVADVPVSIDAPDGSAPPDITVTVDASPDAPSPGDGRVEVPCRSDRECGATNQVCDTGAGRCVDCVRAADCLTPDTTCAGNRCVPIVRCTSSRMCPGQVCDTTRGVCVDCVGDVDCPTAQACRGNVCVTAPRTCASAMDCTPPAARCDPTRRVCVQCVADADCTDGICSMDGACLAGACRAGTASCVSASTRSVCLADGRTREMMACPSAANATGACAAGACAIQCATGFQNCDGNPANGCETAGTSCAPILTGLGGPSGYGPAENCVAPGDDGSYIGPAPSSGPVAISLTTAFPAGVNLGGMTWRAFYLNINGNISFRGALGTYTPMAFPIHDQPVIAAWWADVDTRGGGAPARNNICFVVQPDRVIATWHNVGYFSSHTDRLNTFQIALVRSAGLADGDFDVELRYGQCQWTTGDASGGSGGFGGTPAQAGFDLGDRRTALMLPGSRMMSVLDLCRISNTGTPGVWRYQVRSGNVTGSPPVP